MNINILDVLSKVFGPRGLPFPQRPLQGDAPVIAGGFVIDSKPNVVKTHTGTPLKIYGDESLGQYEFIPALIYIPNLKIPIALPNALVMITGEKSIVETDIIGVGTVFEKVFTRPYEITIICTIIGQDGHWPESDLKTIVGLWNLDEPVTLKCALTDLFLQDKNNFLITKIDFLDAEGSESVEVIQLSGRSNIDFELEII